MRIPTLKPKTIPRRTKNEAPVFSLHDVILKLLGDALASLSSDQSDESVHKARKATKRGRAALRLLRESLGAKDYHRQNLSIRNAARPLTAIRDAFVQRTVVRSLPRRARALELGLKAEHLRERRSFERKGLKVVLAQLEATREQLRGLGPLAPEIASAIQGIARTYRAGRRAWVKAQPGDDDEALHEWRKQAKYLLNELELLRDVYGVDAKHLRRHAHKLGTLLGDDHDLSVLSATMRRFGVDSTALLRHVAKRRRHLQRNAAKQGKHLYRQRAKKIEASIASQLGSLRQPAATLVPTNRRH